MQRVYIFLLLGLILLTALSGCAPDEEPKITVTIVADGTTQVVQISTETTVADVLRRAGITLADLDEVNPPTYNRIQDGMIITVRRIREEFMEVEEVIPFERQTVPNDTLSPGESVMMQPGVNGLAHTTYRITYVDGVEQGRDPMPNRSYVVKPPVTEIVMVGSRSQLPAVRTLGTLAYISGGNAWIIRENSGNRRPLTQDGGVDGKVFELSADGEELLFTRSLMEAAAESGSLATTTPPENRAESEPFNSLWVILDTADPESEPIRLDLTNILWADWAPGTERTIVYSTAERRQTFPGWEAKNDLWRAQISATGAIIRPEQVLAPSCSGVYCWYGSLFEFSPDGVTLAWAQPDAVGLVVPAAPEVTEEETEPTATPTPLPSQETTNLPDEYVRQTLLGFAVRNDYNLVVWMPSLSWSPDGQILLATTHGDPLGIELPEDSPVFNLTAMNVSGAYWVHLVEQAGMYAFAQYSPPATADSEEGIRIAYLQADSPLNSFLSKYRLVVMDRDGSNRHVVYPPLDQPGLNPEPFAWSPDGRQIALISQGNIILIDVVTGIDMQITGDGLATSPRWVE